MTQRATFGPARTVVLTAYTYANAVPGGASSPPPFSDFFDHVRWAENALPVSTLALVPFPGGTTTSFDNSDGGAYLRAHSWLQAQLDRLYPGQNRLGISMQPESAGFFGWCCSSGPGGSVLRFQNFRRDPGPTLAHELGHRWGEPHTFDQGAPFPHPSGTVGSQVGIRTGLGPYGFGIAAVPARTSSTPTYDVMSYSTPLWISPYTYCRVLANLTGGGERCSDAVLRADVPAGPPAALELGPAVGLSAVRTAQAAGLSSTGNAYLYVAGWLNPDGSAVFDPFEIVRTSDDLAPGTTADAYRLVLEDADGAVLEEEGFEAPESAYPDQPIPFSYYLPYDPATARITLRRGRTVLAERLVSAGAPSVRITAPAGGATFQGPQEIRWSANDPDGDPLTFAVDYSPDGGGHWLSLAPRLTGTAHTVDFDQVPGSDRALVRVVVTDGVNTSEDVMDAAFAVPDHGPEIRLEAPEDGSAYLTDQPVQAQAAAFDWEDGAITDPAAYRWSSDRDGELTTSSWVAVASLTPGSHTITVAVADATGRESRASFQVVIEPRPASSRAGPALLPAAGTPMDWAAVLLAGAVGLVSGLLLASIVHRGRRRSSPGIVGRAAE